jgi:DNA-binding transcriptional LysR family regulator
MDIELARTFLEIVSTGSFVRASERLNVGQTTVSARMRLLEQQLGRPLFVRNKSGATLTPAGERFLRYAPTFVQLWQRARHQVALPPGHRAALAIASEVTLSRPLLLDWVVWMRRSLPDVALRVHVDVPQDLINQAAAGLVDAAIMYAPQHRPGLKVDLLMEEKLVLVTTQSDGMLSKDLEHVHVDWGPEFALRHSLRSEETPALSIDLGPLALDYIIAAGGSGYFRMSAIEAHVTAGRLHLVHDAPQFSYPIYVVYTGNADDSVLGPALSGLRAIVVGQADRVV